MKLLSSAGASRPDGGERPSRSMDAESRPDPENAEDGSSFIELLSDGIRIPLIWPAAADLYPCSALTHVNGTEQKNTCNFCGSCYNRAIIERELWRNRSRIRIHGDDPPAVKAENPKATVRWRKVNGYEWLVWQAAEAETQERRG